MSQRTRRNVSDLAQPSASYGRAVRTGCRKLLLGPDAAPAKEGYIFVYQDVCGRWMSEGEFEDVWPDIDNTDNSKIDESTDNLRHDRLADQNRGRK
ncbi:MAG: hypothetical protein IPJ30_12155 [Acidobacteria bacterium]|nr:hypothetical protein [Acidobacteriota bacterium]